MDLVGFRRKSLNFSRKYATLAALLLVIVFFSFRATSFFSYGNLISVLMEWTILGTLALAFTFVAAIGEFDLSFGYLIALCSVVMALLLNAGMNWILAILLTLGIGTAVGLINSLLVVHVGLPAFIATIGVGAIVQGTNYLFTHAAPIAIDYGRFPSAYSFIGQGSLLRLPGTLLVFLPLAFLSIYILNQSKLGRHLYAVGTNLSAARKAGISIARGKIFAFICMGLGAAIVGIIITSRSSSGQSIAGPEYLLDVFASVFLGMSLFKEGEANAGGSLVGAFFMVVLTNGLTLINMPFYILKIFQGIVILAGVGVTAKRRAT